MLNEQASLICRYIIITLEKSQISWSDKLWEMSRKFRVKFPGQKLL